MSERTFQVDLRSVVDLLSHHLYSSPRVYVRELLQNAVDAITAGGEATGTVWFEPLPDGGLRVHDTGVGLTQEQVHELLATIGGSSKRDELGFARHEFLGQFGIGLLSCFLVSDEIEVITRAAGQPTVRWVGRSDGRYAVSTPEVERPSVGTTVMLTPRRGSETWLTAATVTELATLFGSMLPVTVRVGDTVVGAGLVPWMAPDRDVALRDYARDTFGLTPFATIDLSVPQAGLTGVAFVLPTPTNPAARAGHRVYLRQMLLSESAEGLLPDWAFFARCVVDATELRPTASREALYEDSLLAETRDAIGEQLRGWLMRLAAHNPRRLTEFLGIHHLGVKAMALHDDEMLRLVDQYWKMETNVGRLTLAEFRERHGVLRVSPNADQFRQLGAVAAAQDLALINGGYTYDTEIIERLPQLDRSIRVRRFEPTDLATRFDALDPGLELALRPFLRAAQRALDPLGCEVVLRSYAPETLPAIFLVGREAAFRNELRATREKVDPLWADVLTALDQDERDMRPQLVLNYANPLVARISTLADVELVGLATEALYGQALLLGHHPLRPGDTALLNRSFLGLLDRAVPPVPDRGATP